MYVNTHARGSSTEFIIKSFWRCCSSERNEQSATMDNFKKSLNLF